MVASVLMAFAISVTGVMNDGASRIDSNVVHHDILPAEACAVWQDHMRSARPKAIDPVTGRKIAFQTYECTPVRLEELEEKLTQARERSR